MLWPPPRRSEQITLTCGCRGRVVWRIPLVFIYRVCIDHKGSGCATARHVPCSRLFAGLEGIASRCCDGGPPHSG